MQVKKSLWRRVLPLLAVAMCVPLLLMLLSGLLSDKADTERLALAREGVRRAAVQCYALEGFYPPSLQYLTERYGVAVDASTYFVDYQFVASNLMPDITLLPVPQS